MKTILVSGASGIVGYGILRSLRKADPSLKLIGTSIYDDSVAEAFCDVFELAPHSNDENYVEWLNGLVKKYSIDLIIPSIEIDLYKWTENHDKIKASGTTVLLNKIELIELCKDKWEFYKCLESEKSPYAIESHLTGNFEELKNKLGLPFLLKPRRGYASRGIVIVKTEKDFDLHSQDLGSILIAQPIVGNNDEEYSASAFCDGVGGYFASMTIKRKLARDGYTEKAEVVNLDEINSAMADLCKIFNPIGPTNFQFRAHNGVMKLLEINPRISSSTSIRTAFGYNESQMAVDFFLHGKSPQQPLIRSGRAVRYTEDQFFYK